jgi:hypothetical protein
MIMTSLLTLLEGLNPIYIDKHVTKMRYDFQHGAELTSIHHMELATNPDIRFSCISTDKFFENFHEIKKHKDEMARVQDMVKTLGSKAGIKSFLCNSEQHQIVFYEDGKSGEVLTPVKFAAIVNRGDDRAYAVKDAIRKGLAERGYGGKTYTSADNDARFETWVNDYIVTFDSASSKVKNHHETAAPAASEEQTSESAAEVLQEDKNVEQLVALGLGCHEVLRKLLRDNDGDANKVADMIMLGQ